MNYAIAGCGYSGSIHAQSITNHKEAKLTAVHDCHREHMDAMTQKYGGMAIENAEEFCSSDCFDALLVCTPNDSHTELCKQALLHNKHVFCEKPITLSKGETMMLVDLAQKQGVTFFAGHIYNLIGGIQKCKELIASGVLGEIILMQIVHTDWATPGGQITWKQKKSQSGGHLYHHMHDLELLYQIMGMPNSLYAIAHNLAHKEVGCGDEDDSIMILMDYENHHMASLTIGSAFHAAEYTIKIQGTRNSIYLDFINCTARVEGDDLNITFPLHENYDEDTSRREDNMILKKDAGKGFGRPGKASPQWMQTIFQKEFNTYHSYITGSGIDHELKSLVDGTSAIGLAQLLDAYDRSVAEKRRIEVR